MSVSETLLSMVALRLAILVLFAAAAPALSARSHRDAAVARISTTAPLAITCGPATDRGEEDALIHEMLTHD